jgi:hypothetical protein
MKTKPDYEIARDELNELFATLNLPVSISEPAGVCEDGWPCIRYLLTIGGETFQYSLGVGHVDWQKAKAYRSFTHADQITVEYMAKGADLIDKKAVARVAAKVAQAQGKKPSPAEVLGSCAREGMDASDTFADWCANFGYDEDSRKAERTYFECQANGIKARKVLKSYALVQKFAELSGQL